jgi:hypothetical protein
METQPTYATPAIVFDGDLEIQASNPWAVPDLPDLENLDW